jgi:hypothetical protein
MGDLQAEVWTSDFPDMTQAYCLLDDKVLTPSETPQFIKNNLAITDVCDWLFTYKTRRHYIFVLARVHKKVGNINLTSSQTKQGLLLEVTL